MIRREVDDDPEMRSATGFLVTILALAWVLAACTNDPTPKSAPPTTMTMPNSAQARTRTPVPVAADVLDLGEALAQGLVEARIRGNGASSGDSVLVELTRKVSRPLELSIPVGAVLRSQDPAAQDMVVLGVRGVPTGGGKFQPTSKMRLTSDAPQEFLLEAYCLDFDKANPSDGTGFSVGGLASPEVQALLEALDSVPAAERTVGAIQTAIWVVTEDVCEWDLSARFPVAAADVKSSPGYPCSSGY